MKAWSDLRRLPRELWILCLATLVNRLGTMALPFLVLYLTKSLGYSPSRAGAMLAAYGFVALVIGPVAGWLSVIVVPLTETTVVPVGIPVPVTD